MPSQPTEEMIKDCMNRNHVTRSWAILMTEAPPEPMPEQRQADYERMQREAPEGFTGAWAVSLSGHPCYAATPELAEKRAAEMERDYDLLEDEPEPSACGNYPADEVQDMRHPTW
jgi:hypothetical protein